MPPTYEYNCSSCSVIWDEVSPMALRDDPRNCPECGKPEAVTRGIAAPMVLKASFLDGRKRNDLREMVESYKLEAESYDMKYENRGTINKEIKALRRISKK